VNGEARFNVVSKPDRVFDVQVGKVRVKVVGTVFSVRALPARARVAVDKGKVKVFWPGGDAELGAGQSGIFPPDEPTEAVNEADAMPDSFVRAPAGRRTWRELAKKKDYKKAYTLLHSGKDPVRDEPADLMLAADVARLSGHPAQAVAPLRKICERYPSDPRAPLAAFTQGRVLLDNLGRAGEAAIAFQKAQKLWPGGPLFVDALAREAEAWKKAGQIERARSTARRYLAKYPNGRHAAKLKALLEADGLNDARSR
jgi:transmembrane sensor